MKRQILGLSALLIAGFFLVYSCKKSESIQVEEQKTSSSLPSFINPKYPMDIRLARRYYNQLVQEQGDQVKDVSSNQARKDEVNKKKPIWNKAYEGSTDSTTFIEVPLAYNRRSSSIIKSQKETIKPEDEKKMLNGSFDRLYITKNKVTGEVTQYIINYLPSLDYLNKHNGDASNNYVNKLDKDFSGLLQYKSWDGTPVLLFKVENGKIVRKFKNFTSQQGKSSNVQARLVCVETEQWCNVTWEQTCYSGGSGEDYWSGCTGWEITSINYCWDECIRWEDDGTTDPSDPPSGGDPEPDYGTSELESNSEEAQIESIGQEQTEYIYNAYYNDYLPVKTLNAGYKWKCGRGSTILAKSLFNWEYYSYETGHFERGNSNAPWLFQVPNGLEHTNILRVGQTAPSHDYTHELGYAIPNIMEDRRGAKMNIEYVVNERIHNSSVVKSWTIPASTFCKAP